MTRSVTANWTATEFDTYVIYVWGCDSFGHYFHASHHINRNTTTAAIAFQPRPIDIDGFYASVNIEILVPLDFILDARRISIASNMWTMLRCSNRNNNKIKLPKIGYTAQLPLDIIYIFNLIAIQFRMTFLASTIMRTPMIHSIFHALASRIERHLYSFRRILGSCGEIDIWAIRGL